MQLSLHKRGWSCSSQTSSNTLRVIPAQAGMILPYIVTYIWRRGYPCTSGDDPETLGTINDLLKLSLHKRGWSWNPACEWYRRKVIPAQAGMILTSAMPWNASLSYPCTSGDDPAFRWNEKVLGWLSLHKRGWSRYMGNTDYKGKVIPAQAGMILAQRKKSC